MCEGGRKGRGGHLREEVAVGAVEPQGGRMAIAATLESPGIETVSFSLHRGAAVVLIDEFPDRSETAAPPTCKAIGCSAASKSSSRALSPRRIAWVVIISVYNRARREIWRRKNRSCRSVQSIIGAIENRCGECDAIMRQDISHIGLGLKV